MFTDDKITEISCLADDFCKFFDSQVKKYTLADQSGSEMEKEVAVPLAIFIKKVLLGKCTGISFVDSTPLRVCKNQRNGLPVRESRGIAYREGTYSHSVSRGIICMVVGHKVFHEKVS